MSDSTPSPSAGTDLQSATDAFSKLLTGEPSTQDDDDALPEDSLDEADDGEPEQASADGEGDSESDQEESEDDEGKEPTYTVKVDGTQVEVPLSELLKGYSRTADYHRKTQELALHRKAAEAEFNAIRTERTQYGQLLGALQQQLAQQAQEPEPDFDRLYDEDPLHAARVEREWRKRSEERRSRMTAIIAEQQRLQQHRVQEEQQQQAQILSQERELLIEAIPAWKDAERAKAERDQLKTYAKSLGYTDEELGSVSDHRAVMLLHRAWKYDQAMRKKSQLKEVSTQPVRPGTASTSPRKTTELTRAKQRLAQTGNLRDAAAAFRHLI